MSQSRTPSERDSAEQQERRGVAVIGGGPAGLTAALWLGRMLHDVVVIDSGDPRNWETRGVHGFLGSPDVRPAQLREAGRESCRGYGVELVDDTASRVLRHGEDHFELVLDEGGPVHARRLLLAFGLRDIWPALPGLERAYGRFVHTCPLCDGYDVRDGRAVVVGSGLKATTMAIELATWTRRVVICTLGQAGEFDEACREALRRLRIEVCTQPARALRECSDGESCFLELDDGSRLEFDHLFIGMGQEPSDDLAAQLGCARDAQGRVEVDERRQTSVRNVFAAGDLTPGPQLAIKAAGDGAQAALGIHKSLLPEERRLRD